MGTQPEHSMKVCLRVSVKRECPIDLIVDSAPFAFATEVASDKWLAQQPVSIYSRDRLLS